jgi:hypothetical protein
VLVDARPNSSQPFNFSYRTPAGSTTNFSLSDSSTGSPARTFVAQPGRHDISQTSFPTGWALTAVTCDDGSFTFGGTANVDLEANEHVTCSFTNDRRPEIRVVLDAQPESTQQFSYTAGGGLSPSSFALSEPTPNSGNAIRTFANLSPGTYSISQATAPGWDAPTASCSDGSSPSAIDASFGEVITCRFTNQQAGVAGHLTLKLDAQPDDETRFVFRVDGPTPYPGIVLQDDGDTTDGPTYGPEHTVEVVSGNYSVSLRRTETGTWGQRSATCSDGSPITSIQISSGESVTCTLVYDGSATITVNELASTPGNNCLGGPGGGFSYTLTTPSPPSSESFSLALCAERTFTVPHGSGYSITPGPPPSGWALESMFCSDGSHISNISVSAGEAVTCYFRHTQWGQVIAVLDAQPDSAQVFSYTAGGGLSPTSFTLSDPSPGNTTSRQRTLNHVPPNSSGYSLSQAAQPGWDLTSATCDNGSPVTNISVPAGTTVRCTFTNVQQPPG